VARAPWKQRQPSQGSGEHSCGFAGAGVCNRLSFAALFSLACGSMSLLGRDFVRAFTAVIRRVDGLCTCQETCLRPRAYWS